MDKNELNLKPWQAQPNSDWNNGVPGWRLLLVQKGYGTFHVNGTEHDLQRGEALLWPSAIPGRLRTGARCELAGVYFLFQPEQLASILTLSERLLFQRAARMNQSVRVFPANSRIAQQLHNLASSQSASESLEARCQLLELIAAVLRDLRENQSESQRCAIESPGRLGSVFGQISDSDLQQLSVKELARRCGVSRRHLNRLFRDEYGCSIAALKARLRLDKAANLLRDPECKIINVAFDCGYNHLGSFTAKFKERFGDTPGKWRRKLFAAPQTQPEWAPGEPLSTWPSAIAHALAAIGTDQSRSPNLAKA